LKLIWAVIEYENLKLCALLLDKKPILIVASELTILEQELQEELQKLRAWRPFNHRLSNRHTPVYKELYLLWFGMVTCTSVVSMLWLF
jgi:hypothetical protein